MKPGRHLRGFRFLLACTILVAISLAAGAGEKNSRQRVRLFNGKNLEGFYTWLVDTHYADPRGVFSVTNGYIRISGDGLGYLGTKAEFQNYHLTVEFRWGAKNWDWGDRIGKARDSGVFLHATGPDGNSEDGHGAFMAAIECNIFQGATGDFLLIRGHNRQGVRIAPQLGAEVSLDPDADGWFFWKAGGEKKMIRRWGRVNWFGKSRQWIDRIDFRGPNDVERLPGQWNVLEIDCEENRIRALLNGVAVNAASEVFPRKGKILLQCEGSEIFFRRVDLEMRSRDED